MMTIIYFSLAIISIWIAFSYGRWSKENEFVRELKDIEINGLPLTGINDIRQSYAILVERCDVLKNTISELKAPKEQMSEELEKLKADYKELMLTSNNLRKELKEKEEKYSRLITDTAGELLECSKSLIEQRYMIFDSLTLGSLASIWASKIRNKSELLTIGSVFVGSNGKVIYGDGSRSLGLLSSKENAWATRLTIEEAYPYKDVSTLVARIYSLEDIKAIISNTGEILQNALKVEEIANKFSKYVEK